MALGDVNGDNQTDITDAWLLATYKGDLAALGLLGRGKAVSTLSDDVLFSDDFSSGNLNKWTTHGGGSGSLEVEDGALKLVGTAGSNYTVKVSKEIFPTKTYANYVMSFDWKSTIKETPYGVSLVRALFHNSAGERIGELLALNTGFPNRSFEDHGGHLVPGRYGGVFKEHESFGWEGVTINTTTSTPLLNTGNVHRIQIEALVYNDAGSGGDLYVDNFSFSASSDSGGGGAGDKIYWADGSGWKIQRANLDGSQVQDVVTGLDGGLDGLALDASGGKLYWTERSANKIRRANLDGSQKQDLVTGLDEPIEVALDVSGGKMYWVDYNTGKIQRANLDGSQKQDLISVNGPHDIALDVSGGKMYWVAYGAVQRANLDGSQKQDLVTGVNWSPSGIALDVSGGKMYWTDSRNNKIQRANLDGSQKQDLVTGLDEPQRVALDVSGGKMYWTEAAGGKIGRSNLDGSQKQDLVTGLGYVRGIALQVSGQTPPPQSPDLSVVVLVSPSSITEGESVTVAATVSNQGNGSAAGTTVRFYRSSDAKIDSNDRSVGSSQAVGSLAAGGTSTVSATDTLALAGTYYYGACVDAVSNESNASNNCSSGVPVIVQPARAPDLAVTVSVNPSSITEGESVTVAATVSNQGNGSAAGTTVRFYRSSDAKIDSNDLSVGSNQAVGSLAAGDTSTVSATDTLALAGTHYYGACVDAVSGESNVSNNCSPAVKVTIRIPGAPDLIVTDSEVNNNNPFTEEIITLKVKVSNKGDTRSSKTKLHYYLSEGRGISTKDERLTSRDEADGEDPSKDIEPLDPSESTNESVWLKARSTPGRYYYGACVEQVTGESDVYNNCSTGVQVRVRGRPDLAVTASASLDSVTAGQSFTLSATVSNEGEGQAAATTLSYYRSSDPTIDANNDTRLGSVRVVGRLDTNSISVSEIGMSQIETSYYGACVAPVEGDNNKANNCSPGVLVTVVEPDLAVTITSPANPSSVAAGQSFTLSATVRNEGEGQAAATTLSYYRSSDPTIDANNDTPIGNAQQVASLAAGDSSSVQGTPVTPTETGLLRRVCSCGQRRK